MTVPPYAEAANVLVTATIGDDIQLGADMVGDIPQDIAPMMIGYLVACVSNLVRLIASYQNIDPDRVWATVIAHTSITFEDGDDDEV